MWPKISLVVAAVLGSAGSLEAQLSRRSDSCSDPGGGTVAGTVVFQDVEYVLSGRTVLLTPDSGVSCFGRTDEEGRYQVSQVPPGEYRLRLAAPGNPVPDAVSIRILESETITVDFVVEPEDALAECATASGSCSIALSVAAPLSLSTPDRTTFRYWRAALALAGAGRQALNGRVVCLSPFPDVDLVAALGVIHAELAPAGECQFMDPAAYPGLPSNRPMIHVPTGRLAAIVGVAVRETSEGLVLDLGHNFGPLAGRWYRCTLGTEVNGREIERCRTSLIT